MYYLNLYFIGAFIGYIYETILKNSLFSNINNGILYGPWIPVYGIGSVVSSYISNKVFKLKINRVVKVLITFALIFIILTFIEEMGGLFIHYFFHKKFWNYKKLLFNIGPYISLETSILWCMLSFLFIFYLKPLLDLFIKKIPKVLTIGISLLHIIDLIFTL